MSGAVSDPDAAVADRDAGRDIQSLGEDRDFVVMAVALGVFENFDAVAPFAGVAPRIFNALGDPDTALVIERHGDGVHDVRLTSHNSTVNPSGTFIFLIASAGDRAGPGG